MNQFLQFSRIRFASLPALVVLSAVSFVRAQAPAAPAPHAETWHFDQTAEIGGHPTQVIGHPHLIESPYGKAVEFNGLDDALFIPVHPLAGASAYTWEVIFRPDADGAEAQRFFHLQEQDPATGKDTMNRMLFEIRIVDKQWCLDSFASSGASNRTLLNCKMLHPLGQWYRVTAVYDGKELRNYVGDELQGSGSLDLKPQFAGHTSVGVRINKVFYFKGAVLMARMVPKALPPDEFLKMPPKIKPATK
jgi:Concanavalin A-like lectin/glucanases superfamily